MAAQDAQPIHWHYPDGPDVDDKNFRLRGHGLFLLSVLLFSLLLLLTVFCLYLKWARRCRQNDGSAGPRYSTSSPDGICFPPSGLDVEAIKSLPVVLHRRQSLGSNEEEEEGAQCSICLGFLAEGEKVKVLPVCRHTYHPECVDRWLGTHSSCPLCRASLIVGDCKVTKILDAC